MSNPIAAPSPSTPGQGLALREALERLAEPFWTADRKFFVPACAPENLGDPAFCSAHGLKFPYMAGAMANGIGSVEIVETMSRAGMLGFFGAAGLSLESVEKAIDRLQSSLGPAPCGFNFIHSPSEPGLEAALAELYLKRGVRLVEASAFMDLTAPLVRFRVRGLRRAIAPNRIIAKVSRSEVAEKFMAPPPEKLLRVLAETGQITREEAMLALHVPMSEDITVEADSAGHTDNRPALALLPSILELARRSRERYRYPQPLRVGLGGGISTPASAAAAFAMGAAYVLTGSVNQACVESGSSSLVRAMLAQAQQTDVAMAPAADMFEMGVKVQVLKRGTMFAMRAAKLYELYRAHAGLDDIPDAQRRILERDFFRAPLEDIWRTTQEYFSSRDPGQLERAGLDSKHKMALVFRWYLGHASRWANAGEPTRQMDYQVWCGPAMGAFNEWAKGSFLERPEERKAAVIAKNILFGAAYLARVNFLRCQGMTVPDNFYRIEPRQEYP